MLDTAVHRSRSRSFLYYLSLHVLLHTSSYLILEFAKMHHKIIGSLWMATPRKFQSNLSTFH